MSIAPAQTFKTPEHRRTYQRVRRESRWAGSERWQSISLEHGKDMLLALTVYREKLRQPGQRWGAKGTISSGAVEMYRLMINMAVRGRGRLEPSVGWLAEKLNVPAKVIHAWKSQLKEHGFLRWQRRYVESGLRGRRGPQVKQISNAYALLTPTKAWEGISKIIRRRPKAARGAASSVCGALPMTAKAQRLEAQQKAGRAAMLEQFDTLGTLIALDSAENDPSGLEGT
ncbi:hypothetical protein GCM10009093_21580 [Brevundimonas terrae]|uniref:Helix-turn-helix domain-containing protein n=1 Tax=Brevundimonas terrae TaxID=363631 RepID=A0ABN0YGG5_9CAUL|nr:hypothetical protein [Brevundimonas terrae]NIJ26905.1 hypothetical protein [Brevundimonas terrae]